MEINTLTLFISLFILSIIISSICSTKCRKSSNPPGPRGLPLIGILHHLKYPLHEYFLQLSKKYGPLLYLKIGSRTVLVANSPKTAEQILRTQDLNFCSRPALLGSRKLFHDGHDIAFSPYNDYWREMRKTCVLHLLSVKRVNSFRAIREDEVARMVEILSQSASGSEKVDLTAMITFLTSTVISRVAFGKRYERGSSERRLFADRIREFQISLSEFYFTDYFPWLGWLDHVMGKIARLDMVFKKWDSFYQQLIDEHLQPDRPKSMDGDVLDILLKLRVEEPSVLPLECIKAILLDMYFASTDTIATTTIWAMTALIKNPRVMKKAQTEIRELMSPTLVNKQILEEQDIMSAELPYLNAVIRETLRKYMTVPLLVPRETMKNCTINEFEIPAKTLVYVNAWGIGNDPDRWENPKEFRPERFFKDDKLIPLDFKAVTEFDLLPFGAGRRGCPGISLALTTIQLVLANLICKFNWDLPDGQRSEDVEADVLDGITLHKKNPLYLIANKFIM